MRTRTLTALVALPLLLIVVFLLPGPAVAAVFSVLSAIAAYEFLRGTGVLRGDGLALVCCLFAALVPPVSAYGSRELQLGLVMLYLAVGTIWAVADSARILSFSRVIYGFFGALVIPFLLSSLLRILIGYEQGRFLLLMPCVAAWASDTFAYFTGLLLGRRKLAPRVSPKKTVEGAIGGLLGAAGAMCLFGWLMGTCGLGRPDYFALALAGLLGGFIGQCGDLSMSLFKRERGIKDFGKIFPGHGGVLDRFDSILFAGPVFEIILATVGIL